MQQDLVAGFISETLNDFFYPHRKKEKKKRKSQGMSYTSEPLETLIKKEAQIRPEYSFVTMKGLRKRDVFKKEKTKHVFKMNFVCAVDGGESDPSNRSQGKDTPRRKEESYESIYCSLLLWLRRGRARVSYGFVVLTLVNVTQRMFSS